MSNDPCRDDSVSTGSDTVPVTPAVPVPLQRIPFIDPALLAGHDVVLLSEPNIWLTVDGETGELLVLHTPPGGEHLVTAQLVDHARGVPVDETSIRLRATPTRPAPMDVLPGFILGYTNSASVVQGGSLQLHVSTDQPVYDVVIYRAGANRSFTRVARETNLPGTRAISRAEPWHNGAGWPLSHTLPIPVGWDSGLYRAVLAAGEARFAFEFVVRPRAFGAHADVLVLDSAPTVQAYNAWGGRSLYPRSGAHGPIPRAHTVSPARPTPRRVQLHTELELVSWLENEGIAYDYASMLDLEAYPSLLDAYRVVLIVGHNEYWTRDMRVRFERFLAGGGNAMIMSGNTMWWQIRIEDDRITCYKSAADDPITSVDPARTTTHFHASPVDDPEERTTGLSFRFGGFVNHGAILPHSEGHGGYTVAAPGHWAYQGTGVRLGEVFGREAQIVGYEADGAPITFIDGMPRLVENPHTPPDFRIIAFAEARGERGNTGHATPGLFPFGAGCVFNAATINWASGLRSDPVVRTMTRNVIDAFSRPTGPETCP